MKSAAPIERLVEDLVDAAVETRDGEGEDAEHDEAVGAQRGEGCELLEVGLDEREQSAVDDADGSESDEQGSDVVRLLREDDEAEAQDGVEAELAGEHHDGSGGGLLHGLGEPAVQREDRDLDAEGEEERERAEQQRGAAGGDGML